MYDLAVAIQILFTIYYMTNAAGLSPLLVYISFFLYLSGLLIFWWAILTAKSLDFAFSDRVGSIVTSGPFKIVRNPFYISYILVWLSSSLLFNSPALWISLFYLIAFYILSARKEEKVILRSVYSEEYENYVQAVGMFLPRIKKWKPLSSEP
jgi:protein-S-isoprenylcysteine O-methyltransferase Ste14